MSSPAFAAEGDWPMFAHDPGRSGATPVEIRPPFERKWYRIFPDEGLLAGIQPIVAGGNVYVGTMRGVLHAIDAETGDDVWTFKAGGPILHTCAAADGKVFFGAADGKIYAVNAADGSRAWTAETGAAIWNTPAVHNDRVVIGSRDGKVYCCDADTGDVLWTAPTGGPLLCSPAIDAQRSRVYIGSEDMHVYAFDFAGGRRIWRSGKLPGASFRGYHPVVAPDGSVLITVTPMPPLDYFNPILYDMVAEIFGDFASWRHTKEENEKLRKENFAQLEKPDTYYRELNFLRQRLSEQPAFQTFFVLDGETGKQRFVAPIVYGESMNGTQSPAIVTPKGKVLVKFRALLRSRYQHYSPFLNVGYLDTKTGHIEPALDESRTYGWHDSLLLVHDEQCQLAVGGRVLFNTHQDNVNALDLDTKKGYGEPMCWNVHEAKPGVAIGIWTHILRGLPIPVGWEWLARGTAVYGGGSVIDVPISIAGDSFYYVPTHEINAGAAVIAYRMKPGGDASRRRPEPVLEPTPEEWKTFLAENWDWDTLERRRLNHVLQSFPRPVPGTRQQPLVESARAAVAKISDADLDRIIEEWPELEIDANALPDVREELNQAVTELVSKRWKPLVFPSGKHPTESYRFFVDPTGTLYTLALAWPYLTEETQKRARRYVEELSAEGSPLAGPVGRRTFDPDEGDERALYGPAPVEHMKVQNGIVRTDAARIYPLWLWAETTGDWKRIENDWHALRSLALKDTPEDEIDLGNGRIAGMIAACRIARRLEDKAFLETILPLTRAAMRERLQYELAHTRGGLIAEVPVLRHIFARWRHMTPDIGRLLAAHAGDIHRDLMAQYVDYHRPTWWIAWMVEHMFRNESPFVFPTAAMEIFSARALILEEPGEDLAPFIDIPWCKADEFYIRKMALTLRNAKGR